MPDQPSLICTATIISYREALRQAARALEADEVPIVAVIVHARIITQAFNQVEALKDTA